MITDTTAKLMKWPSLNGERISPKDGALTIIPHLIAEKIGGFSMNRLTKLSLGQVTRLMSRPETLHRFPEKMAGIFHSTVARIARQYAGDASRI